MQEQPQTTFKRRGRTILKFEAETIICTQNGMARTSIVKYEVSKKIYLWL